MNGRAPPPPEGYAFLRSGATRAFAMEEAAEWCAAVLAAAGSLSRWAEASGTRLHGGRGSVRVVEAPLHLPGGPSRWLIRRYRRGGGVAPLLVDRYLRVGEVRPLGELRALHAAADAGVSVPLAIAGAWRVRGPFYRAELTTAFLDGSRPLSELWCGPEPDAPPHPDTVAGVAGAMVRLARGGVLHRDLNATNILVGPAPGAVHLVDFDRARVHGAPHRRPGGAVAADARRMLARLVRSLRKLAAAAGQPPPSEVEHRLRAALEAALAAAGAAGGGVRAGPAPGEGAP